MNIFIEYLNSINSINLIISSNRTKIKEVKYKETSLQIDFEDGGNKPHTITFDDFLLVSSSFKAVKENVLSKTNGHFESVYRFHVRRFRSENFKDQTTSNVDERNQLLTEIKCSKCDENLINRSDNETQKFNILSMPENDLEELAENFFCHLHDHSHNHDDHNEHDLTDELNPLRDANRLRKSVLSSRTILVLNKNHIRPESVKLDDDGLNLLCSNCSHIIGYKNIRRVNDYYVWKSETRTNFHQSFDLLGELKQGRYLIESAPDFLFVWVVADDLRYKQISVDLNNNVDPIVLNIRSLDSDIKKKVIYKCYDFGSDNNELVKLRNDINVADFHVSRDYFQSIRSILDKSSGEMCESLKESNEYDFAIIKN